VVGQPLGSYTQGLSPLFFHLMVGYGCGLCQGLGKWGGEREGSIVGERNFFFSYLCVFRERRRPTVPIASARAASMAIFIVYLFNLGVAT
jgi:hypothetical protein